MMKLIDIDDDVCVGFVVLIVVDLCLCLIVDVLGDILLCWCVVDFVGLV